jgi:hypothetical protein
MTMAGENKLASGMVKVKYIGHQAAVYATLDGGRKDFPRGVPVAVSVLAADGLLKQPDKFVRADDNQEVS